MIRWFFVLALCFVPQVVHAEQHPFSFDLETDHIAITTGFAGQNLVVFGFKTGKGELEIIVEGPKSDMIVRKKSRIMGAWVNSSSERLKALPIFYDVARSVHDHEIDYSFVDAKKPEFKKAFLRNKQAEGLYTDSARDVTFIDDHLFRVDFYIPSNVPVGFYTVRGIYTEGDMRMEQEKSFHVGQVGMSARTHEFSRDLSLLYGALCVGLAVFAGWFSNRVRKQA